METEAKPVKKNNAVSVYAVLTTISSFISIIALFVVVYLKPNETIDPIVSKPISTESSVSSVASVPANVKVNLSLPKYNDIRNWKIIEFTYPDNLGVSTKYNDEKLTDASKQLILSAGNSQITVSDFKEYKCERVEIKPNAISVNDTNYLVPLSSDESYDTYYWATKHITIDYVNEQYTNHPCYLNYYLDSWNAEVKIKKGEKQSNIDILNNILINASTREKLTVTFKGNLDKYRYASSYDFSDPTNYYYFLQLVDGAEGQFPTEGPDAINPEDLSNLYILPKDLVNSSIVLGTNSVGKEYILEGQLATISEGMPSSYKFYSLKSISKK
ncbi:MAG: hypothetical protein WCO33_02630 [bacterium]